MTELIERFQEKLENAHWTIIDKGQIAVVFLGDDYDQLIKLIEGNSSIVGLDDLKVVGNPKEKSVTITFFLES